MDLPIQISFRHIRFIDDIAADARERAEHLRTFYDRIYTPDRTESESSADDPKTIRRSDETAVEARYLRTAVRARARSGTVGRLGFTMLTGGGPGVMEGTNRGARDAV